MNAMGISVSYTTIYKALRGLSQDSMTEIQGLAVTNPIVVLLDNLNWMDNVHHQLLNNPSTFHSATTVTIVIGEDLGGDLCGPVDKPIFRHLLPDKSHTENFMQQAQFYLFDTLQRAHEVYHQYAGTFSIPPVQALGSTPTLAFEIGLLDIDQSTVAGNMQVIEEVRNILQLPEDMFAERKIAIAGDLLTVSKFQSLKQRRISEVNGSPFERMEWAIPVFQLFHLQMAVVRAIMRTHFGSHDTPGSLAYNISMLGRKRVGPEAKSYHDAKELLRNTFDAMVQRIWLVEMGQPNCSSGLVDCLENERVTFGHDDTQLAKALSCKAKTITGKYFRRESDLLGSLSAADVNAALFIRDMVVYLELCAAIKNGDIGRLEAVLKTVTIMLQAGGSPHYAIELLRLHHGIRYTWTPLRKTAVLSSMLMNTKGRENSWLPSDLYQEHNNRMVKECIKRQGSNRSMDSLKNVTTPNIRTLDTIAENMDNDLGVPYNAGFHRTKSAENDIKSILDSLVENNILSGKDRLAIVERDVELVDNLLDVGITKLINGQFSAFLARVEREDYSSLLRELETGIESDDADAVNYISSIIS